MAPDHLVDVMANIRYRLRHDPISDDFVEWLEETLKALRHRYKKSKSEFKDDDILFLRHLSCLIPALTEFLSIERKLKALQEGRPFLMKLPAICQKIEAMNEESFAVLTKQCLSLESEIHALLGAPNHAVERDAPQVARASP